MVLGTADARHAGDVEATPDLALAAGMTGHSRTITAGRHPWPSWQQRLFGVDLIRFAFLLIGVRKARRMIKDAAGETEIEWSGWR